MTADKKEEKKNQTANDKQKQICVPLAATDAATRVDGDLGLGTETGRLGIPIPPCMVPV